MQHTTTAATFCTRRLRFIAAGLLLGAGLAQAQDVRVLSSNSAVANQPTGAVILPAGAKLLSGGAKANWTVSGSLLTQSQPSGPGPNAWAAGAKDHLVADPASLTVYAVALSDSRDTWDVMVWQQTSAVAPNPVASIGVAAGYVMTGGGCVVNWKQDRGSAGNLLTASYPISNTAWECRSKDHGAANPSSITAYVIGIRPKLAGVPLPLMQITSARSIVEAHPSALAPALAGFTLSGGGARAVTAQPDGAGQLLTASFPEVAAGSAIASGWRAASKDHAYASPGAVEVFAINVRLPLDGWVDLHTHPMSHLAFGGKLFHGAPDVGSLVPAAERPFLQCAKDFRSTSIVDALGVDGPTHGNPTISPACGDFDRHVAVLGMEKFKLGIPGVRLGAPVFVPWPAHNDWLHQKMWFEWIDRARAGRLRVMVALSHNNRTLGDLVGPGGPISGVTDDVRSSDLQIAEIKSFVGRHLNMMEVALTPADVYRIAQSGRIAGILGVELDNIGNWNRLPPGALAPPIIRGELQRLHNQGVRYVFPVHLTDNVVGGTAIYDRMFNWANYYETGRFWTVECARAGDDITLKVAGGVDAEDVFSTPLRVKKLRMDGTVYPPPTPTTAPPNVSPTGACPGHRNARGLTPEGQTVLREMMKLGMLIDVDHMDEYTMNSAINIAEQVPEGGYPLLSGHNSLRKAGVKDTESERAISAVNLTRIACLGGMLGLGTGRSVDAHDWAREYAEAYFNMGRYTGACPNTMTQAAGRIAIGSDTNTLGPTPPPPRNRSNPTPVVYSAAFPRSRTGAKEWDYNREGVAHYGMYSDFIEDVRTAPAGFGMNGGTLVEDQLMRSADHFYRMWLTIDRQKSKVR